MIRRPLLALVLMLCFVGTALATYTALDRSRAHSRSGQVAATGTRGRALPGTMYVAQHGRLYSFRNGVFKQLTADEGWTQPALSPDGSRLVAVKRAFNFSDLYVLGTDGKVQTRLTNNASGTVEQNHWAFYPRFSPDGTSVFYSYDAKDPYNNFRVDLAVYSMAVAAPARSRPWTAPNHYTGGDVGAIPLRGGALVYTKYSIDAQGAIHPQVWMQARALSAGVGLTPDTDDCGHAAVAGGEDRIAMLCRQKDGTTALQVASLDAAGYAIGNRQVLQTGRQISSPAFSADGSTIAFLAPVRPGGAFQLWTTSTSAPAPGPAAATPVTTDLAFDSTAAPAWM